MVLYNYNFAKINSMSEKKILDKFITAGAVLKGHFKLSSGLHSDTYIQCSKIAQNASLNNELCSILAERILQKIDLVVLVQKSLFL